MASDNASPVAPVLVEVTTRVHLLPSELRNTKKSIVARLDEFTMSYEEEFNGIVLTYFEPEILDRCGEIYASHPHITFHIRVKFLVLPFKVGSILEGEVIIVGESHAAILFCGVVNVTINDFEFPSCLKFEHKTLCWNGTTDNGEEVSLSEGSNVYFQVQKIENVSSLQVFGSLRGLEKIMVPEKRTNPTQESRTPKKSKKKSTKRTLPNGDIQIKDEPISPVKKKKKKSKSDLIHSEVSPTTHPHIDATVKTEPETPKKKKSSKKHSKGKKSKSKSPKKLDQLSSNDIANDTTKGVITSQPSPGKKKKKKKKRKVNSDGTPVKSKKHKKKKSKKKQKVE